MDHDHSFPKLVTSYVNPASTLSMDLVMQAACLGQKQMFGNQAEIVMTSDALRRRIPGRVLLEKAPKWFVHRAKRGWFGLRINGLLKRKCKKGARKHYSKK